MNVTVFGASEAPVAGKIADFSADGIALVLTGPLGIGEVAHVDTGDDLLIGEVRHCNPSGPDYAVGFSITSRVAKSVHRSFMQSFQMA